ncbi:MAG: class I SAM-dependent methyltransferase [Ignavibacteriales bacterium]|nr:MAG: class I SAM-dependent methyltransferase [Ignavibacteriales bacterium]
MKGERIKNDLRLLYDDIASEFSATRAYPWKELQVFIPYIKNNFKILDLGCGNGRLLKSLEQADKKLNYLGVDFSAKLIEQARANHPQTKFIRADMSDLSFDRNTFDIVFMIASFHHIPSQAERLDLLYKINGWLKPGGLLFMTNWNLWQKKYLKYALENFWSKKSWNDFFIPWTTNDGGTVWRYYHSFTTGELIYLLKSTNFDLEPEGVYKTEWNINAFVRKSKPKEL